MIVLICWYQDLGIAYIIGVLKKDGYDCQFFGLNLLDVSIDDVLNFIHRNDPLFVGFKVWNTGLPVIIRLVKRIKKKSPDILIVGGGPLIKLFESTVFQVLPDVFDILVYSEDDLEEEKRRMSRLTKKESR